MVLRSGLPVELIGWHLCRGDAVLNANEIDFVLSLNSELARFAIECKAALTTPTWSRPANGDRDYPPPRLRPKGQHAVDAIIEAVEANPGLRNRCLSP
jgi:inosine-uridine nucleoside N-ribohydrolase